MIRFRLIRQDGSSGKAFVFNPIQVDTLNYNLVANNNLPLYCIINGNDSAKFESLKNELHEDMIAMERDSKVLNDVTMNPEYKALVAQIPKGFRIFHLSTDEGKNYGELSAEDRRAKFKQAVEDRKARVVAVANEYTAV